MIKLYEITDNQGYTKYYVKGVKSDKEATKLGKSVFGSKCFHDVSHYSDDANKSSIPKRFQMTKDAFKKLKSDYRFCKK